jgi:hypothetical protein
VSARQHTNATLGILIFLNKLVFSFGGKSKSSKIWVVGHTVNLRLLESNHKAVRTELDVLTPEMRDDPSSYQEGKRGYHHVKLDVDSIADDHTDATRSCRVDKAIV